MDTQLKIHLRETIALVRGIRLKSEDTALAINNYLTGSGYVINPDPKTWRYYLNLNGEYHESDVMMRVISNDTQEEIDFTKENLKIHLLTAKTITVGSRQYKDLKAKYPTQESLIKGIINPIDMQTAIDAKNHKILTFPSELVESNEGYLIPALQEYIDNFFFLRHNPDYMLFDQDYYVALLGDLRAKMVLEILRLRQAACKTERAHSFHVRQYLLSNSPIGKEFDYLTFSQRMWFYKNIRYINRNIGQKRTFETLIKRVLTDRGFSLVGYDLTKTTEGMVQNLVPTVTFSQVPLNPIPSAMGDGDKTVRGMLADELGLAIDNIDQIDVSEEQLTLVGQTSRYGSVPTKVLESNVIDRTDSDPFTISEVTLNHWIYLGYFNRYQTVVAITNPDDGDVYNLSMRDAFLLFLYCYNKAIGVELIHLPRLKANRVLREPLPTFNELRSLADKRLIPDYYITKILGDQPQMVNYVSTQAFRGFCKEVWTVLMKHRELRFFSADFVKEGYLHTLVDRCYMDIALNFGEDVPYETWLAERGILLDGMRDFTLMELAQNILTQCTGADLSDTTKLRDIHEAMIRIMRTLSSYSVQYINEINDSAIKVIDGKFPMMTSNTYRERLKIVYDAYFPRIQSVKSKTTTRYNLDKLIGLTDTRFSNSVLRIPVPVNVEIQHRVKEKQQQFILNRIPMVGIRPLPATVLDSELVIDNPHELPIGTGGGQTYTLTGYSLSPHRLAEFLNRSEYV